ncbi:amino acid adenylation domain-containing protein [Actinokineospora baliensis]|uniref:non-ribosomal peptide synthetase n=1 Tax=Actinokineospora baliensis TaxID=547056 RepID=UPI00195E090C|nr:non-ribosomal peptide synthetase [Actinokineospora baliensis]MBM7774548.1 amino acid adenylation domain-containing protein [Actinokineospora baliensis]
MAAWLNSRRDDYTGVHECFAAQVARVPDEVAVAHGAVRLTYRELDERANRLAHRLLELGVGPQDPVAVLLSWSPEVVVAFLAVLKAGGCYLPLHEAYPLERKRWIVDNVTTGDGGRGVGVLLADRATADRGLPDAPHVLLLDDDTALGSAPATDPGIAVDGDRLAYVMYTSGSTGHPKGVEVTHRGVLCLALDSCWDSGNHERTAMVAPYAFGVSTYEVWVPLLHGGRIVLKPAGDLDVRSLVADGAVTGLHLTAGLFRVLADEDPGCLAGVREVMTGGDVISPTAVRRVLDACPGLVVRALYGGTEMSSFAIHSPMTAPYTPGRSVPVGRPMDEVRLYVLDPDSQPVPDGEVGELHVAGPRLARGYAGRPDLTAERFVPDPFTGAEERMYRTGDLVRRTPEGLIEFVARVGDQVKIRGYLVELGEVEAVLGAIPGLANATVIAGDTELGDQRLIAYLVPETGGGVEVDQVREHALSLLPEYMVPTAYVVLDALPLTPNGKLDRKALPAPAVTGTATYRAPTTDRQRTLCRLFGEVLEVPAVGLDDSFFDLDGQSLLAMRLVGRIRAALGGDLSISDLFDAPTPAELDKRFDQAEVTR